MKRTIGKQFLRPASAVARATALALAFVMSGAHAQPGPTFSAGYDLYPHSHVADPDAAGGAAYLADGTIRVGALNLKASYPLVYSEGRTVLVNELMYRRFDLDFSDFPPAAARPENMQAFEYNATLTHGLSEKWTLMGIAKPGIASDFEGDVGSDDMTFQVVALFIRGYSDRFQVGYGAAWANTFGQPFPLPVLAVRWNNGSNLRISSILPSNLECWYAPSPRLELGFQASVEGNQYHGDPDIYGVDNPLLRYSVGTVGPSVNYHLSKRLTVGLQVGTTFLRRFKFFDGDNEEDVDDISLENTGYARIQLQVSQ